MGVDTSELYVVDALWDEPEGLSQRSICEACDMGKQTISAICKRLAARDVVVAHAGQADKRELEMKAAGAIGVEEGELFIRVIKQYAKTFQEEVQR